MRDELINLLESYLRNKMAIEAISDWIATNAWDTTSDLADLIDQVSIELSYMDDGISNEKQFRSRIAEILASFKVSP